LLSVDLLALLESEKAGVAHAHLSRGITDGKRMNLAMIGNYLSDVHVAHSITKATLAKQKVLWEKLPWQSSEIGIGLSQMVFVTINRRLNGRLPGMFPSTPW
jgi:hypothetical protein